MYLDQDDMTHQISPIFGNPRQIVCNIFLFRERRRKSSLANFLSCGHHHLCGLCQHNHVILHAHIIDVLFRLDKMKGESTCRNTKALQKVENILFSSHKFRATRNKEESQ